ncbi:MFS transporter [Falsibacillus pallidus]|uniref:Sugar phosphate permease n=1 Tax=Falsibacillus pallidus TaxID=493781 RepID=A0A370FYW4_9BACI|nr:MFS transporter [Falsibacillus pallidus]RDI36655.1 sugar phosphate permease [Falsibacillus pallidus]
MNNKYKYFAGIFINGLGDGIQQIALMWYIYHLTGEAASIGLMIAIYYLPSMFLTPFVSVYVDHRDSKNIVIITDFLRFLLVFIMAALIYFKVDSSFIFYLLQFLLAVFYTIYKPASQSFLKEAFTAKELPFVISKASSLNEAALIAGTGVSGIFLVSMSLSMGFFINSLTFLFAALFFFTIKRVSPKQVKQSKIVYFAEMKKGWQYIQDKEGMKYLLFLSILNSISIQMATTLFLPLAEQLRGGSGLYSSFEMAFSAGGIIAGLVAAYFMKKFKHKVIIGTMGGMLTASLLLFFSDQSIPSIFLIFILGLFTMSHLIVVQTLIQLNTTKEFIGRVIGLRTILASFVKISSALLTGAMIAFLGVHNIFLAFAIIMLASFITISMLRKVSVPV